ncbi:MAG: hypothetical protein K2P55_01100, partial [Bacteroides acidifaciens]|nr:hypothetical protein [Bacteroides acidifaciens]
GQACEGEGEEGHIIIFTRARCAHEERKKKDRRRRQRTTFTSRQKILELHTEKTDRVTKTYSGA